MLESPLEANIYSASLEISCLLWYPRFITVVTRACH